MSTATPRMHLVERIASFWSTAHRLLANSLPLTAAETSRETVRGSRTYFPDEPADFTSRAVVTNAQHSGATQQPVGRSCDFCVSPQYERFIDSDHAVSNTERMGQVGIHDDEPGRIRPIAPVAGSMASAAPPMQCGG